MLTITYLVLAVAGCGYVAVALVLGQLFDGDGLGGDADAGGFHFPLFSPAAIATLCGAVGAFGLIGQFGFRLSDSTSLLVALPAALVFTYIVTFVAWRLLATSVGTTALAPADLEGATAEILTPIPAGGVGEAAAMVRGQRFTAPAREMEGLAVPRGAVVTVVRLSGSTLLVRADLAGVRNSAPQPTR